MVTAMEIRALLETRQDAVEKATVLIYQRQTDAEKAAQITVEKNGVGFNAFDAGIMTSYAEYILENRWGRPRGHILSPKQLAVARKKIVRYVGQIASIANAAPNT